MSKDETQEALVPRLRFPEFRDAPEWNVKPLGEVARFVNTKIPIDQVHIEDYVSTENLLPDYRGVERATKLPPSGSAIRYEPDDILLANIRPYLKKVWRSNKSGGASNDVLVIRPRPVTRKDYLPLVIANDTFINYVMKTAKGVKMPRGDIASMKAYNVYYPELAEQQKISECVGSLHDLIAAERRKLAALRDHKKGLMQKLFPHEGETQPRLRFPEFRDAGEWEAQSIEQLCEILNNRRVPITSGDRVAGPYPYYGASGIVDYVDDYIFDERLVLVGEDGAKWEGFEPTAFIADGKYWVNNHAHVLKPIGMIDTLLASYLTLRDVGEYVTGAAPPKLTLRKLKTILIPVPPSDGEQQRIADCLSALDDWIALQAEKLDALRTHKRGLMQQLFPSPEEVEA